MSYGSMFYKIRLFEIEFERIVGRKPAPYEKAIAVQRFEKGQAIREVIDSLNDAKC